MLTLKLAAGAITPLVVDIPAPALAAASTNTSFNQDTKLFSFKLWQNAIL
jgi:hypothetical protein